jgi:outer membrane lipoprotein SlyB
MKLFRALPLMLLFTLVAEGCVATTTTSSTMWAAPGPQDWARPGAVEWVRETVHRTHGDPAGGALAGALIGGMLGRDSGEAVAGAIGGAVLGAMVSSGSSENRTYEVAVRFDDGGREVFLYEGRSPFRPGQPVVQGPGGLAPY